jgi:hypothetical protein
LQLCDEGLAGTCRRQVADALGMAAQANRVDASALQHARFEQIETAAKETARRRACRCTHLAVVCVQIATYDENLAHAVAGRALPRAQLAFEGSCGGHARRWDVRHRE